MLEMIIWDKMLKRRLARQNGAICCNDHISKSKTIVTNQYQLNQ